MPQVTSSAISPIEYDRPTAELWVWFNGGRGPYTHFNVPESMYHAFLAAPSKGSFFGEHIRDSYEFTLAKPKRAAGRSR